MNKINILVTAIVLGLLIIPLTIYLANKKQEQDIRTRAAPATTLSVLPGSINKKVGDTFSLNIQVDTAVNQIVGADLKLSFDNLSLEAVSLSPGDFFDNPQILAENINNEEGTIIYSIASFVARTGSDNLASISFQAKAAGESILSFEEGTSVAGIGEIEALKNTVPGIIIITGGEGVPTPTPIVTATPTLTTAPSPTPTLPPGITPTTTPRSTPTSTAANTPLPTPTPTFTPTVIPSPAIIAAGAPTSPISPSATPIADTLPDTASIESTFILFVLGISSLFFGLRLVF